MTTLSGAQESPDVPAEQQVSSKLIKRIRKLRWIGMDEEAQQLEHSLCSVLLADTVLLVDARELD